MRHFDQWNGRTVGDQIDQKFPWPVVFFTLRPGDDLNAAAPLRDQLEQTRALSLQESVGIAGPDQNSLLIAAIGRVFTTTCLTGGVVGNRSVESLFGF